MLKSGDKAPLFTLPDADMRQNSLEALLAESNLVLYFYPKDDTPGCTLEALEFTDLINEFKACNTRVWAISRDNCESHGAFRDKYGLAVRLLADIEGTVCRDYGVLQMREANGEQKESLVRSTFVIDRQGTVREALYNIKPKHHAADILERVRRLAAA